MLFKYFNGIKGLHVYEVLVYAEEKLEKRIRVWNSYGGITGKLLWDLI